MILTPADDPQALAGIAAQYTPVDWQAAWSEQPEATNWLYGEFIEAGTLVSMYGRPGTGKSLLALEIAADLARSGYRVVYVDQENKVTGVVERLQAMGRTPEDVATLRLYSFAGLPPLDTAAGGVQLLALAAAANASLVILDTTSRLIAGRENDADTYLALYRLSLVPLLARGVAVLRLDHPGKDAERGQRGSSAKDGDVDAIWRLATVSDGVDYSLTREKSRSGHGPSEFALRRCYGPLRHEWGAGGDQPAPVAQEPPRLSPAAEKLRAVLTAEPATIADLTSRVAEQFGHGLQRQTASVSLTALVSAGFADRLDMGPGRPALWASK